MPAFVCDVLVNYASNMIRIRFDNFTIFWKLRIVAIICKSSFLSGQYTGSSLVSISSSLSLISSSVFKSFATISTPEVESYTARTSAYIFFETRSGWINIDLQSLLPFPWMDHHIQPWRLSGFHSTFYTFEINSQQSLLYPKLQITFALLIAKKFMGRFFLLNTLDNLTFNIFIVRRFHWVKTPWSFG